MAECPYCRAGAPVVKLRRQYVHRIGYDNVVCTEQGFQAEPGAWSGERPREWIPRRLREKYK